MWVAMNGKLLPLGPVIAALIALPCLSYPVENYSLSIIENASVLENHLIITLDKMIYRPNDVMEITLKNVSDRELRVIGGKLVFVKWDCTTWRFYAQVLGPSTLPPEEERLVVTPALGRRGDAKFELGRYRVIMMAYPEGGEVGLAFAEFEVQMAEAAWVVPVAAAIIIGGIVVVFFLARGRRAARRLSRRIAKAAWYAGLKVISYSSIMSGMREKNPC